MPRLALPVRLLPVFASASIACCTLTGHHPSTFHLTVVVHTTHSQTRTTRRIPTKRHSHPPGSTISALSPVADKVPPFAFHRPHPASAQHSRQHGAIGPPTYVTLDSLSLTHTRTLSPPSHFLSLRDPAGPASTTTTIDTNRTLRPQILISPSHHPPRPSCTLTARTVNPKPRRTDHFLACNPHSSFALSHRAPVCAYCLSPVVLPIARPVGSAPSPASGRHYRL